MRQRFQIGVVQIEYCLCTLWARNTGLFEKKSIERMLAIQRAQNHSSAGFNEESGIY
jgi:hypothetical protein